VGQALLPAAGLSGRPREIILLGGLKGRPQAEGLSRRRRDAMKFFKLGLIALLVFPALLPAQKKEIVQLNRDLLTLQDQVKAMQNNFTEKMGGLTTLLQQVLDSVSKMNTTLAVLDNAMKDREKNLAAPITNTGAKVDTMASEFQAMRVTLEDLNSRFGKLQQQITDLSNTIKVIQTPATPPPGSTTNQAAAGGPPSGLSAAALWDNALRDKDGGNYDMALQELNDYLKYYRNTDQAAAAQYYIGWIQYTRNDFDAALESFNAVLEQFPKSGVTLEAMYMKGLSLVQLNQRTEAKAEFQRVMDQSPAVSDLHQKAAAQVKAINAAPAKRTPAKRSKKD
jgi:TolA-binding protein